VKVIFLDFFKSSTVRTILVIYLIFFAIDKAHSINAELVGGTQINGLTSGQLQNIDIETIRFLTFDSTEFSIFSSYSSGDGHFRFYGHPGSEVLQAYGLQGDLSAYDYLISWTVNHDQWTKNAFSGWFASMPSEPYPADDDGEEDPSEPSTGFDINDLDYDLAGKFFASGFAIFILPWVTAYGYSSILRVIKES
jgi:hypothetical protein